MEADLLLNSSQVAEWLNVAESTIRKWVHYGFIPHVKLGRSVRFMRTDVERWLQERSDQGRRTLFPETQRP
jgi:excisionase family DNA binding protein